jgi:hypothetical protein
MQLRSAYAGHHLLENLPLLPPKVRACAVAGARTAPGRQARGRPRMQHWKLFQDHLSPDFLENRRQELEVMTRLVPRRLPPHRASSE